MKNKVLIFIIGLLVGAIIATGGFYYYLTTSQQNITGDMNTMAPPMNDNRTEIPDGTPPMPSENSQTSNQTSNETATPQMTNTLN